mmetsp:Transcript_44026/g.81843  ORF Transcript_44026/g.81843 Transcript_44026/m.81843 type:complete len:130 (-) Transcript_44026:285-674(-)
MQGMILFLPFPQWKKHEKDEDRTLPPDIFFAMCTKQLWLKISTYCIWGNEGLPLALIVGKGLLQVNKRRHICEGSPPFENGFWLFRNPAMYLQYDEIFVTSRSHTFCHFPVELNLTLFWSRMTSKMQIY